VTHHDETADMSKHSEDQLRSGIERSLEQEQRIAAEESPEALEAARRQREAMEQELERRRS
jgi:hypothetical protein